MLPAELPFSTGGWPRRWLGAMLGEAFLGFLAIVALVAIRIGRRVPLGLKAAVLGCAEPTEC